MIYYKYLIFILSFLLINSDPCNEENDFPSTPSDCFGKLSEEKKENDYKAYCCYYRSSLYSGPICESLTQEQYDYISDYIKIKALVWGEVNITIDCNSSNIKLGLFNILLFFIYIIIF